MFSDDTADTPGRKNLDQFVASRLLHMEQVLSKRDWLAGEFPVADIVMSDALRLVDRFNGLEEYEACREYSHVQQTGHHFKTYKDQIEFYAAADTKRNALPKHQHGPDFSLPLQN